MTPPAISVVVPVYNGAASLRLCLEALGRTRGPAWECIVVDDGSDDESGAIARARGARVLRTGDAPGGPARARNLGAAAASAPLVCFIDADVLVRPETLAQFVDLFDAEPDLTAAFGSYDTQPASPDVLSQYRNLLHHFVHQTGREAASTFWAGCGAVRREAFVAVGGFDASYTRPSIEDIELGTRLRAGGARITLAKHIQVTHLKRWSLWEIVRTDIRDRAVPWSRLIARTRRLPNDLNLSWSSRVSAIGVYALAGALALRRWPAVPPLVALLLACNARLYLFFFQVRGPWFLLRVLPLHWLYYAYSALAFAGCMLVRDRRPRQANQVVARALVRVGGASGARGRT
jgi:glycosyltransferase involved in cell wall biosynthesis